MNFSKFPKKEVITLVAISGTATIVLIVAPSIVIKAGALIFMGGCLSIGFKCGKDLMNLIENTWTLRESNVKRIAEEITAS
jgi:hypothetical protein